MNSQLLFRNGKLLLIILTVIAFSCKQKDKQTTGESGVSYSEELAREISFVTNGDIHFDDIIQVYFNDQVVEENEVGSSPENVFTFSPKIKGRAVWESQSMLKFIPDEPLPSRTKIDGRLNLQKLAPRFKEINLEDLVFSLNILGRDITNFTGSLDLKDRDDPKVFIYRGSVSFSENTTLEAIQKASDIKGGKGVILTWSQLDDRNFQFSTNEILRTDSDQEFTMIIDRKSLDLEYDYSETFTISPLKKMIANDFRSDEAGRSPRIRIGFSDELDIDQNIDGLVNVNPSVKFAIKKLGNSVILDGDFKFGETYKVTVQKGISSRWGIKTESDVMKDLRFSDIAPQLEFASDGIVLPTSNQKKVQFYTTNLKRVHLEVKKVFTNQIGRFLESEQLTSTKTRNRGFSDGYSSAVGVIIKNQTIELGNEKNEWLLNEFDLSDLFEKYDDGLFLIRINFTPEDVNMPIEGEVLNYIAEKGQVYKPVFLSNLGMTVKISRDEVKVFVTDILTGRPRPMVSVSLLDYNGDSFSTNSTNSTGLATFNRNDYFYYVLAVNGKELTALNREEMRWSSSGFDVGGIGEYDEGTRGFIYLERGVYRPGDSIHVSFMVKNNDNTFPQNHPVMMTVYDPEYNIIFEKSSMKSVDGFYVFALATEESAPTGTYNIRINAGGSWFYQDLKIETVVAEQLKVQVKTKKKEFTWQDKSVDFDVVANYLFGAPAADLNAEVNIEVHPYEMRFAEYAEFTFTRNDIDFSSFTQSVLKKQLDAEGKLEGSWMIPSMETVPSALRVKVLTTVLEKGGQTNEGWAVAQVNVYPNYVGLKDPSGYGYFKTGAEVKFPVILLDPVGKKVTGRQVRYRIYRNDTSWWYQYDNRRNYHLKYKEDSHTYLEKEGTVTINEGTNYVSFIPSENGEYLIEVSDGGNGHSASMFFSAYQYGGSSGGDMNEGSLALRTDKAKYSSSETAKVRLPNPGSGNILVTIEKGSDLLRWFWIDPSKSKGEELVIDIPLDKSMLPNVYVTVSVIQPHDQTVNDRPIRMFGIIPVIVEDSDTKIMFNIDAPEVLVPNKEFTINISTQKPEKVQFTIAVVDEGLLSLTQFQTPRPWNEFFKKVGLFVESFDIFSHVISANKADIFQTFSIGGDLEMDYRESQLDPVDGKKRFKPVSMFKGPLMTDERGRASVKFTMPEYNGAVRVMVVGMKGGTFGNADKTIPVRSDIIMQPAIPRVLNPGDEFLLPVALFKMAPSVKNAQFTLSTEGPLEIIGEKTKSVDFSQNDEADIIFKIRVKEAIGQARIILEGTSGNIVVRSETDIKVVPTSPRLFDKSVQKVAKGQSIRMMVPKIGLDGTNYASLDLSLFPDMDFDHRLRWLIAYPYGCLEQTTSSVFPQLYLKKMGYFRVEEIEEIDRNINAGIGKLQQFMLGNGGFAYWPGNTTESEWGTNYAVHFLTEAKKMGYAVPDYMYNNAIRKLNNDARQHLGKLPTRVNRVFILALAGQQPVAEMNLIMENELEKLSSSERWMLATAYHLTGAESVRDQIIAKAGTDTKEYEPFSYNYGSKYRDDAIILYCAVIMGQMNTAELIAKSIASTLSGKEYLSTQSSGYMLLALGRYFDAAGISAAGGQKIIGSVTLGSGRKIEFNEDGRVTIPIKESFNQEIQISISGETTVENVFASLSWNGVPLKDETKTSQKNLSLQVAWYDEAGNIINPQSLKQGATFYGKFSVKNTTPLSRVSDVALVQIIPSGWQIENIRLSNALLPDWTNTWALNRETYLDIRDDRAMWFFDLINDRQLDFVLKLNCVSAGEFWLPATLVEAMYSNDYRATTEGKKVYVEPFK